MSLCRLEFKENEHSRNQRKWVPKKYEKNKEEFAAKQNIKIQIRVGNSGGQHNQVQMCGQFLSDGRCVENNYKINNEQWDNWTKQQSTYCCV